MSDLIEVSELDTGHREIRIDRVRPIDILRDAYIRSRDEARKKNIEIEIQAFSDLSYVNGDRRALRSIMDNLLSNAVRYTPEGGSILLQAQEHGDKVSSSSATQAAVSRQSVCPRSLAALTAPTTVAPGWGLPWCAGWSS